jgi:hypothetical protein
MKFFERIEHALQKLGRPKLAGKLQILESYFVSEKRNDAQISWIEEQSEEAGKMASIVQREKEERLALTKLQRIQSLGEDEKMRMKGWEEELKPFDKQYCLHKQAYLKNFPDRPKGPLIRLWDMFVDKDEFLCKADGGCCESVVGVVDGR